MGLMIPKKICISNGFMTIDPQINDIKKISLEPIIPQSHLIVELRRNNFKAQPYIFLEIKSNQ